MQLHLGVDIAFARKRWVYGAEWVPIVKEKMGVKYIEFCSDFIDPVFFPEPLRNRMADEVRQACKEGGLEIFDMYTGLIPHCLNLLNHPEEQARAIALGWCENLVRLSARIGAKGIGGHFDTIPFRDWTDPSREKKALDNIIDSMVRLSEVAKEVGQGFLALEQMYTPNERPYTLEEAEEMLAKINERSKVPVYLTVDVGHMCSQNYTTGPADRDPLRWLERFGARSPVIHIQQTTPDASNHWPFTKKYNALGHIRPDEVVDALRRSGSKENYLMLEIFFSLTVNEETILSEMAESAEYWRPYTND